MTVEYFDNLVRKKKIYIVCCKAVKLCVVDNGPYRMQLMQFENFYIEILFSKAQFCIKDIRGFYCSDKLDIYLEQIDISSVLFNV